MSGFIKVNDWISAHSYNFEKENSKSYIIDEKNYCDLSLDGISSDIWYMILKTQDYESVCAYAKKLGLKDEIDSFLEELADSNVITFRSSNLDCCSLSDLPFENTDVSYPPPIPMSESNSVCGGFGEEYASIEEREFIEERTEWLYSNNFLQSLSLQLNYKCNLSCKHCFNDKDHNEIELNFEQVKNIIDQAYDAGIINIGISGGECTCNKDFLRIIRYIREKRLSFVFLTNGQKLYDNRDFFENTVSLYPHRVKLSLYSMDEKIHDGITRTQGSFKKTVEVIKKLRERNISVTVNFLQLTENFGSYNEIVKFATSVGAKTEASVHFIDNSKNKNSQLRIQGEKLEQLYLDRSFPSSVYNEHPQGFKKDERHVCRASEIVLAVNPFMIVTPCSDFDYPIGDLNKESFKDIWNINVPKFREKFLRKNMVDCGNDEYCKYCSYCPVRAYYENGFLKKSSNCCENAIAFGNALKKMKAN